MEKKMIRRLLLCLIVACVSVTTSAQTNADNLFLEGQKLQKTMTIVSQNAAIKKFQAAKVLYTTASKKTMCDNQISACNANIKKIKGDGGNSSNKKSVKGKSDNSKPTTTVVETPAPAPVVKKKEVELSLSASRLDFKCKPKEGYTQSVNVTCNYDDWIIAKKPEWITVYTTEAKFSVEAAENTTEEDRSGIITVKCDEKEVDLIVNQDRAKGVDKIVDSVKGIFKKKKK